MNTTLQTYTNTQIQTNTTAWSATTGQINLNAVASGNYIALNSVGSAPPVCLQRSAGTKLVLAPLIAAALVDAAIGVESNTVWYSTSATTSYHRW